MNGVPARYQVLEKLGQGGMGEVYLARDLTLDRKVALKFLTREKQQSGTSHDRILREARAAASLDHPYVCKIYEVVHSGDADFIVMEYIEGTTLRARLGAGPMGLHDALVCACEIAEALDHAHSKGVIHRDLKPANVMLTTTGHIKILDFGLAKRTLVAAEGDTLDLSSSLRVLHPEMIAGTPMYMSPEQLKSLPVDARSDIFAFGTMLYEMLTGVHPFLRSDLGGTCNAIANEDPPAPSALKPDLPDLLLHILRKALAKSPEERYQSAHEVFTDLKGLRDPDSITWSGVRLPGMVRRGSLTGWMALAVAMAVSVYGAVWWFTRSEPNQAPPTEEMLIDWPSNETEARISPDGNWFSFLSYQGGKTSLWKKNLNAPAPEQVEIQGNVVSHVWSRDGQSIACWVQDGPRGILESVPGQFRDKPKVLMSLDDLPEDARADLSDTTPRVVAWINGRMYLEGMRNLWIFDQARGDVKRGLNLAEQRIRGLCIRSDEKKIVYDAQDEIWMADPDGAHPEKLTENRWRDFNPRWIHAAGGWRVVFSANPRGQLDLYWMDPERKSAELLLSRGQEEMRVEDASGDGSKMLCRVIRDEANLWCFDPKQSGAVPVTTGSLCDFAPTLAAGSKRFAFQRIRQKLVQGSRLIDTEIFGADLGNLPLENPQQMVEEGSSPHLAPDGRHLAYLLHRREGNVVELRLKDLSLQKEWVLSRNIRVQVSDVPMEWLDSIEWSGDGARLYFVDKDGSKGTVLRECIPSSAGSAAPPQCRIILESGPDEGISDPRPDPGGNAVACCVMKRGTPPSWEVRRLTSPSQPSRPVLSQSEFSGKLYCTGWQNGSLVVIRSFPPDRRGDSSGRLEVLKIGSDGTKSLVMQLERAYGQTAKLNADGQTLYVTSLENDISNIAACDLSSGKVRLLSNNRRPDITYSGLQGLAGGRLIYSQQKHVSDIYLLRFAGR